MTPNIRSFLTFLPTLCLLFTAEKTWSQDQQLQTITVTGIKQAETLRAGTRTFNLDSLPGAQGANLWEVLKNVPGVEDDGSGGLMLRGQPLKVEIDGLPVQGTLQDALEAMPVHAFSAVEVRSIADAKADAGSVGGVLRVLRDTSSLSYGSWQNTANYPWGGMSSINMQAASKSIVWIFGADAMTREMIGHGHSTRTFADSTSPFQTDSSNIDMRLVTGSTRFGFRLLDVPSKPHLELGWRGMAHYLQDSSLTLREPLASDTSISTRSDMWRNTVNYVFDGKGNTGNWDYAYRSNGNYGKGESVNYGGINDASPQPMTQWQWNIQPEATLNEGAWKWEMGSRFLWSEMNQGTPGNSPADTLWNEDRKNVAAWIQPSWKNEHQTIVLGIRYEQEWDTISDVGQPGFLQILPNLTWEYSTDGGNVFSLSAARRIKPPNPMQLIPTSHQFTPTTIMQGNPSLQNEIQNSAEIQWDSPRPKRGFSEQAYINFRYIEEDISPWHTLKGDTDVFSFVNAKPTWQAGTGLIIDWKSFFVNANIEGRIQTVGEQDAPDGNTVKGGWWPVIRGRLQGNLPTKGQVTISGEYSGQRPTLQGWVERNPTMDFNFRQPLGPASNVFFKVQDIFNSSKMTAENDIENIDEHTVMVRQGRTFSLGIQLNWGANVSKSKGNRPEQTKPTTHDDDSSDQSADPTGGY